ncbi:MAG: FAD-binding protein [Bacteroidaceae bacterium]|nr:FAD-binding protein [Bacteroidaceae bacterium]
MITEKSYRLTPREASSEQEMMRFVAREEGIDARTIKAVRVLKRSIDARQRNIFVNVSLRIFINEQPTDSEYVETVYRELAETAPTAVVVGAGPGGLFAALRLIEHGIRPIVIERGKDVRSRKVDIARISREHVVDGESNYSFGEGGAGAYSDGKLYTRSKKRGDCEKILNVFCQHGASVSILSDAHPHIGTDKLPRVIENMRTTILRCGGEVHFQTRMTRLITERGRVVGVEAEGINRQFMGSVILATGHSARDVYRYLDSETSALLEAKSIAVGVRLEHPSELIDQIQYHSRNGRGNYLPAAEYSFVNQVDGRGVYSFCMCPGGFVVPAATGEEQVVVNGMSPSNRAGRWSNSGMVVEVHPEDLVAEPNLMTVLDFQESLERLAWQQGGRRQTAPAQRMADFVNNRLSYDLPASSYQPGLLSSPLHFWLPDFVSRRLQEGFRLFGRRSHGFLTNEACVIGVETRTSSPLRIVRDRDTLASPTLPGLYPCGEGAGYAGGIVSAAVDGERCADKVAEELRVTVAR